MSFCFALESTRRRKKSRKTERPHLIQPRKNTKQYFQATKRRNNNNNNKKKAKTENNYIEKEKLALNG